MWQPRMFKICLLLVWLLFTPETPTSRPLLRDTHLPLDNNSLRCLSPGSIFPIYDSCLISRARNYHATRTAHTHTTRGVLLQRGRDEL
jgi:hypothetical protein